MSSFTKLAALVVLATSVLGAPLLVRDETCTCNIAGQTLTFTQAQLAAVGSADSGAYLNEVIACLLGQEASQTLPSGNSPNGDLDVPGLCASLLIPAELCDLDAVEDAIVSALTPEPSTNTPSEPSGTSGDSPLLCTDIIPALTDNGANGQTITIIEEIISSLLPEESEASPSSPSSSNDPLVITIGGGGDNNNESSSPSSTSSTPGGDDCLVDCLLETTDEIVASLTPSQSSSGEDCPEDIVSQALALLSKRKIGVTVKEKKGTTERQIVKV